MGVTTVRSSLRVPSRVPGGTAPASAGPVPAAASAVWLRAYVRGLLLADIAALLLAAAVALLLRFGADPGELQGVSYYAVAALLVLLWLVALALSRCYEFRFVGGGPEEFRRVGNASVRLTAFVALIGYGAGIDLARGFVAIVLPLGLALLLVGRYLGRLWLYRERRRGRCAHRVLVVGNHLHVNDLVTRLAREPLAGLVVVGACVPGGERRSRSRPDTLVPIVGTLSTVRQCLASVQADTVAVAASPGVTGEALRQLSYELEGTGVDLVVAPALTNITGTRVSIRAVAGLPLLHLDEPELTGARQVVKGVFDWTVASIALLVLAPVLLGLALAVRLSSPGPALFRQERVGRDGRLFRVLKFRSMVVDAEQRLAEVSALNDCDGVLFKLRDDPRVTRVGRMLRRWSLDELPQLVNVLRGEMSLVGPRPPLPSEVSQYETHTHRRLMVKPGMTGLWQVNGRADLSWEETVRLDLQYVENWSLGMDLAVLSKTVVAVVKNAGAY